MKKQSLLLASSMFMSFAAFGGGAMAQGAAPAETVTCPAGEVLAADGATCEAEVQEVVVTGSRLGQSARDAATPVAVVSAEDIRQAGAVNIE
ncbi:MAG: hypothetical protein B7Z26_10040, partial [Asticcacaulis sp. 32-58-5]